MRGNSNRKLVNEVLSIRTLGCANGSGGAHLLARISTSSGLSCLKTGREFDSDQEQPMSIFPDSSTEGRPRNAKLPTQRAADVARVELVPGCTPSSP